MIVYAALHNPMYHESDASVISLHRTLKGAYKAMRKHRVAECIELREMRLRWGSDRQNRDFKYDDFKWWGIVKYEVEEDDERGSNSKINPGGCSTYSIEKDDNNARHKK